MFAAEAAWPRRGLSSWICGQEAVARALERLDRERAGNVGRLGEPPRADDSKRGECAHELGPVHEREPFLGLEAKRLEPRPGERVGAREKLPADPCPSLADERQREMRQRSEVAARPDRASARHLRQDTVLETIEQPLGDLRASPGVALRKRVRAHEQRRADDLVRIGLADAASMAAQQVGAGAPRPAPRARASETKRPNPVVTPYVGPSAATARSTTSRAAAIFSRAESSSSAAAPSTATSQTSAVVRSSPVRRTTVVWAIAWPV